MIRIESAKSAKLTEIQFQKLYNTLILAYELTEVEVWGLNYIRISEEDYHALIEKDQVLIAMIKDEVVGGVHCYKRQTNTYSFSLLCADFNKSGLGIGRALIDKVEEEARENNAAQIEIEILRAKGIDAPFKIRLADWYERMGYHYTHSQNFIEINPVKAMNLANPSDFDYYRKDLK